METSRPEPPPLLAHVDRVLARLLGGLLPEEKRYWILVPLSGVASGLLAVGFINLLALVQGIAWGDSKNLLQAATEMKRSSPWRIIVAPIAGGTLVALGALFLRREKELPGTLGLLEALAFKGGRLPLIRSLLTGVLSIVAVGSGASLGREGALINSGASLASWLGSKLKLKEHHVKILLACGAAGGIAAAYNVPIAASVFAMEVLLGSFALELFGPIIISSVIATALSRALIGTYPAYEVPPYPLGEGGMLSQLAGGVALGLFMGLVSALFIRVSSGIGELVRWLRGVDRIKPVLVMAALGGVAVLFPELLGNGYDTVNLLLHGNISFPVAELLIICALKIFFTALCRAGGVPGGLFTPSLFVGALLGTGFAVALAPLLPQSDSLRPTYALLGMGAILAGTIHAPITAVLMVFELTQTYSVILPLMSACLASTLVSRLFQRGSLFTEPLLRKGLSVPQALAPIWIRQPTVRDFLNPGVDTVGAAERFEPLVEKFLRTPVAHDRLYVVDREGRYLGVISLHEIKRFIRESQHLDSVIAADILNSSFPCVYVDEPMSRAVEILAETDAERLPVLESPESRKLVGSVSKRRLLAAYREMNLARITQQNS